MKRGRKPIFNERITTTVSLEKDDLVRIHDLGIELTDIIRTSIKETLCKNENRLNQLNNRSIEIENTIDELQTELKSIKSEIHKLESKKNTERKNLFGHQNGQSNYFTLSPINTHKDGTEFHHMYLKIGTETSKSIGVYIPKELHRSVKHQGCNRDKMRAINNAALLWLCEQATI